MKKQLVLVSMALASMAVLAGCSAASLTPERSSVETSSESTVSATVSISGGFETKAVDNGRPVVLVAAALGVPEEVFRTAFSGVTPAAGGTEPDPGQVNLNKAALLKVLAPYGITNEQLDAASNYYRYSGSKGETWPHSQATAVPVVTDGVVTGFTVTDPGAGYTSAPTITLSDGRTATATISYGKDTASNGSITAITLD